MDRLRNDIVAAAVLAGMLAVASNARADGLYTLTNVIFDDGGTATGVFDVNILGYLSLPQYAVTTPGSTFGGTTYDGTVVAASIGNGDTTVDFNSAGYKLGLHLVFADPLSGTNPDYDPLLLGGASYEICNYGCTFGAMTVADGTTRDIVSGAAEVPEPASLAVLGAAFLGLGATRFRGRRPSPRPPGEVGARQPVG
jgi:hypothetical protein